MTLIYNLFCIPGNIDEVVKFLRERNTIRANVYIRETENWSQGMMIRESLVDLGQGILGPKEYLIERRVLDLKEKSELEIDEEDKNNYAVIMMKAAKAREKLRKEGFFSDIIYREAEVNLGR